MSLAWSLLIALAAATSLRADPRVIVSSRADPDYTRQKFAGEKPKAETSVVMQGHFFEGNSADPSVQQMSFRHMVEIFAPELGRRQYFPAKDRQSADLLIVVHWGTTNPRATFGELAARTTPLTDTSGAIDERALRVAAAAAANDAVAQWLAENSNEAGKLRQMDALDQLTDQILAEQSATNAAQLLGYAKELRELSQGAGTTADEFTLRSDLRQERYFIILKAYDLHQPAHRGVPLSSVWTLHLNMSSPGNNFDGAVSRMSVAAVDFVGRTTEHVTTLNPKLAEGKVEIGPLLILGEAK